MSLRKVPVHTGLTLLDCQKRKRRQSKPQNWRAVWISEWFKPWLNVLKDQQSRDIKQRQGARTTCVAFVVASHYQSLQIVVLLLQACLLGSLALLRTLLVQQLQWLQQDRGSWLFTRLFSCCLTQSAHVFEFPVRPRPSWNHCTVHNQFNLCTQYKC